MRRRRSLPAIAFLAVTILAGVAVPGIVGADPASRHHGRGESRLQEHLGLTDDQMQAIRQIHAREAEARTRLRESLRQAQTDLRRLILTEADETAIGAKQAEVQALMAEALERRVNTLREIGPILTSEQREKYVELMERSWRTRYPHRQSS